MSLNNTHYGDRKIASMLQDCRSMFFIGIGGISMSALAAITYKEGMRVGGSDRGEGEILRQLAEEGVEIFYGHDAKNINGYDAVVYTVAIGEDNPEYTAALSLGLPCISRADYLGYLMMKYKQRVGIAGMHGKSTTTAMCNSIFKGETDATVLCGALLQGEAHRPYRIGKNNETMVFEACEYMDSFLDFSPTLSVILNIGLDHVDYFKNMEAIRTSFLKYAELAGEVLFNADDPEALRTMKDYAGVLHTFSIENSGEFTAQNITAEHGKSSFDLYRDEMLVCKITLQVPGIHNVYNALAAAAAALLCGVPPTQIEKGLSSFQGAGRRMEYKGKLPSGAVVYDDYAHHPDEIRASLAGVKEWGYRRVLCAYQPHTYSRTAGLWDDFVQAFDAADLVFFADIYAAREINVYGVSSKQLAECIGERARHCQSFQAVADAVLQTAGEGDLVLIMGAGDIYRVFDRLPLV